MLTTHKTRGKGNGYQGMNWIRPEKRLAIYLRDGLACVYCGAPIEEGTQLSLDHIIPYSKGGSHDASNLVTCCSRCNSARGNRSWKKFASAVAEYLDHGITADAIVKRIENARRRVLLTKEAKAMIAARGKLSNALESLR